MRTRILTGCLLPLVLAAAAACSKSDDGKGIASVGGSAAPSATPTLSFADQGRRHAQCMREHGVPEADPEVRPDGSVRVGGGYDKHALDQDVFDRAMQACRQYEPVLGGTDGERKREGAREYSRCMRAHGVEDFPDPAADGRIELPQEQTDPDYDRAKEICSAQPQPTSAGGTR